MVMGFSKMYNLSFFLTIFSDRAASTAEGFPDIFEGIPNIFGVDCDIDAHTSPSKKKFQPYD